MEGTKEREGERERQQTKRIMRNEGETVIIRQREKGRPTVSNTCSIDREMKEMDTAFTS